MASITPRRTRAPAPLVMLSLAAAMFAVLAPATRTADAQQTYELGDEDNWIEGPSAEPGSAEARLAAARRALAEGDDDRAEFLATQWIENNPDHPMLPDAYVLRGDALRARGDYYRALFDYELVARLYAGSDAFVTAVGRELEIAKLFANGLRRRFWGMRLLRAVDEAEELLIRVQERLPGSRLAEDAGMTLGDFYFSRRQMDLAAEMYALFIENYPRSEQIRKARKRLIYAHLASFKGPEFDAAGLYEAKARLLQLEVVDPVTAQQIGADALLTRIDESDARKLLTTAKWYLATNDPIAAELTIRRLIRAYPRSVATVEALDLIPTILPRLSDAVLATTPDYEAIGAGGAGTEAGVAPPADDPRADPVEAEPAPLRQPMTAPTSAPGRGAGS